MSSWCAAEIMVAAEFLRIGNSILKIRDACWEAGIFVWEMEEINAGGELCAYLKF